MVKLISKSRVEKSDDGDDKISNLPDELLCHVLSFLPTKDSVATSILSNRWRPQWRFISTFDFCDLPYSRVKTKIHNFVEFVDGFLDSRDVFQSIKRFRLHCFSDYTCNSNVNKWINYAIDRQLEYVDIHVQRHNIFVPSTVFTCQTLVVLKLRGLYVDDAVSSIWLPSLKFLHLDDVHFPNRGFVLSFLSECPVLENLFVDHILYRMSVSSNICFVHLPKLISADINYFNYPLEGFDSAQFLRLRLDQLYQSIPTFPNLVRIELLVKTYKWNVLAEIVENSPKIQVLVIIKKKTPIYLLDVIERPFSRPTRISTSLRKCHMKVFEGEDSELLFAKYIMENAKALHTMKVSTPNSSSHMEKLEMIKKLSSYKRISPECQLLFE